MNMAMLITTKLFQDLRYLYPMVGMSIIGISTPLWMTAIGIVSKVWICQHLENRIHYDLKNTT